MGKKDKKKDEAAEELMKKAVEAADAAAEEMAAKEQKQAGGETADAAKDAAQAEDTAAGSTEQSGADAGAQDGTAGGESGKASGKNDDQSDYKDRLIRTMAEFDNYRKRTEKEKQAMYDMGVRSMAEKILPTIDNFERSLAARPEDEAAKAYADGMEMVYRQLLKNLEEIGITPIEALGKPFDPNLHNAVMHDEDDSDQVNIVTQEFQKGYMYKDHVVRHSMVKVLN